MFRTDDGMDVMKLYFECFDRRELLFTCSTNYFYPSKRKQIQPKTLILTQWHTNNSLTFQSEKQLPLYRGFGKIPNDVINIKF